MDDCLLLYQNERIVYLCVAVKRRLLSYTCAGLLRERTCYSRPARLLQRVQQAAPDCIWGPTAAILLWPWHSTWPRAWLRPSSPSGVCLWSTAPTTDDRILQQQQYVSKATNRSWYSWYYGCRSRISGWNASSRRPRWS